jgi:hypothetical protein
MASAKHTSACSSILRPPEQVRQLRDVRSDAPRLVLGQPAHRHAAHVLVLVIDVAERLALRVANARSFPWTCRRPARVGNRPGGAVYVVLKAPGIVIGYLSAWRSRNSERSNAVTAAIANEDLKTARKKLCLPSSVRPHEYLNCSLTSRLPCLKVRGAVAG